MKLKCCPWCKEYLNETEEEQWCSVCDYSIYIKKPNPNADWEADWVWK